MPFGEASIEELLCVNSEDLADSFDRLGVPVEHISITTGAAVEVKDRLGGIKLLNTASSRSIRKIQAGVVYNPSDELRRVSGIKGEVDILLTVRTTDFDKPLNKESDKFIVNGVECRVEDFTPAGLIGETINTFVIGLRSN